MFGDEKATKAVLKLLRDTKVGYVVRTAPPRRGGGSGGGERAGPARPKKPFSFVVFKCLLGV